MRGDRVMMTTPTRPTPFAFALMVEMFRELLTTELGAPPEKKFRRFEEDALDLAGAVKAKRNQRSATSDWMALEQERGADPAGRAGHGGRAVSPRKPPRLQQLPDTEARGFFCGHLGVHRLRRCHRPDRGDAAV